MWDSRYGLAAQVALGQQDGCLPEHCVSRAQRLIACLRLAGSYNKDAKQLLARSVAAISACLEVDTCTLCKTGSMLVQTEIHLRCPFVMAVRANLSNRPMKKRSARLILGEVLMGVQGMWAPRAWAAAMPAFSPSSWKP